jgi:hypothetical protein
MRINVLVTERPALLNINNLLSFSLSSFMHPRKLGVDSGGGRIEVAGISQ